MNLRTYKFHPYRLDPVTVFIDQIGPSSSTVTVQCYSQAWTAHFGAHGNQTIEEFLAECDDYYLTDKLDALSDLMRKTEKARHHAYVMRVAMAVIDYFKAIKGGEPCYLKN